MWLTSTAWKTPAAADWAEGSMVWSWVLSYFLTNRDEDFGSPYPQIVKYGVILLDAVAGWRHPRSLLHKGSLWFFFIIIFKHISTYWIILGPFIKKNNAKASHHNETSFLSFVEGPWLFLLITAVQSSWEMLLNTNPSLPGSSLFERDEQLPAGAWLWKPALCFSWPWV